MKKNSKAKSKRSPRLLTVDGVEILAIPPSIKRMARGRKVHIWTRPFKCGLGMATDEIFSENPEEVAFNQRLMKKELEIINRAVGSLNMSHIKSFLIQRCNVPDPTNLTWREILANLEVYLHSQKAEQEGTPETEQNATPAKRWRVKTIPYAISAVVVFLAALLTIFHYLGWLEPIRAFIYKILLPK